MLEKSFCAAVANSFNKVATSYNNFAGLQFQVVKNLCNMMTLQKSESILDLGCGSGYVGSLVGKKIIQLDIAFNMCKLAQSNGSQAVNANMALLPFSNNCMDTITSSLALHWSYDILKTISEIYRVMRSGGQLFISIPVNNTFYELNHILELAGLPVINFFTFDDVLGILTECGFIVDSDSHITCLSQSHNSFEDFIRSIKRVGANVNKNRNIINRKMFNVISELYEDKFAMAEGVKVSWYIGYIVASK